VSEAHHLALARKSTSGGGGGGGTGEHSITEQHKRDSGVSESARYACETCGMFFCIDCDLFAHEIVHNCPGCQSREGELSRKMTALQTTQGNNGAMEGVEVNGANGA